VREKPGTPYRAGPGGVAPFLGRRNHSGELAFLNELHMAHAAKGDLATAMGPEFEIYAGRRAPYIPNGDFRFVDRIMRLDGTRSQLKPGAHMETEYDAPPEAWYFRDGYDGMPNCIYMESSLQAAILLGYYLGATLSSSDEELSIRNLDGKATIVKDIDLRGKTIRHSSTMLSSQAVPGAILQNFRYELSADGEVFYRGESLFGYFTEQALATQVGLDSGKLTAHWLDEQSGAVEVRRMSTVDREEHFRLIDQADVVVDGGRHGLGYVRGRRRISPDEWYFSCHFHRDPVMPGSLGVEAVVQALEQFAVESGLVEAPVFTTPCDVQTAWRYRGQILRTDHEMSFELHVKEVQTDAGRVRLIADAGVWKHAEGEAAGLRIYELTDIAVETREEAR
jgi:3-hydroxymyristoyl/3-hydroxydecanoyl-(acyl carrier protein) dehydratase